MRENESGNTFIEPCNSFAVPYISALISNELTKNKALKSDIRVWFRKYAYSITDKFSTDYYNSLLNNKELDEPINICILSKNKKILGLDTLFNKNQYTAVEFELNHMIRWNLTKRTVIKDDFINAYKIICKLAQPDIIIWHTNYSFINKIVTNFFDAVLIKEDAAETYNFERLLCADEIVFKYGEGEFCKEVLFNNIRDIFS